jgi:CheY-like chemotaxis protein
LEAADRQKDEFLAMLAHELRNPLAPIRNAGELLARAMPADQRAQRAAAIVKRQVSHLTRLVDDLLDVSRITRGQIELRRVRVSLTEILSQALETVEPLFREKQHRVSVTSSLDPLFVDADPARLVQCVGNVLANAAKYTDTQGEIRIESHARTGQAVLTVTDNGAGIPGELLPHVFDLFVQGQRTLDRSQGGLGIGLSVVRRLVEMHGGEVSAGSSGPGTGAVFTLRLPLISQPVSSRQNAGDATVTPRRILVVDDNQDAAESLAMLLALDRHEVVSVGTPREALERCRSFRPEIVLLDIGLPDMDGYEVARRIRAQPELAGVRLIALTGYGQYEDKQRARKAGFDDHLVKPVELALLQQALQRA